MDYLTEYLVGWIRVMIEISLLILAILLLWLGWSLRKTFENEVHTQKTNIEAINYVIKQTVFETIEELRNRDD